MSTTVVIHYTALPGHADTLVAELHALIRRVVATEPDCLGIRLLQDDHDPHRILLDEVWTSEAAFTGPHQHTPHLLAFRQRAPGFIEGPPTVSYWTERADVRPA